MGQLRFPRGEDRHTHTHTGESTHRLLTRVCNVLIASRRSRTRRRKLKHPTNQKTTSIRRAQCGCQHLRKGSRLTGILGHFKRQKKSKGYPVSPSRKGGKCLNVIALFKCHINLKHECVYFASNYKWIIQTTEQTFLEVMKAFLLNTIHTI